METREYILIQGLWESQTDAINDIRFGDSENETYKKKPMKPLLVWWDIEKKENQGKHCHEQRETFFPFVLSVDIMLGKDALFMIVNLS